MFTPEAKFILYCSRTTIDQETLRQLGFISKLNLNWKKIISLSLDHGTAALIYQNVSKVDFLRQIAPPEALLELKNYYRANLVRTLKLWHVFCIINDNFVNHGIKLIPLKGIVLGNLVYHNPALRPIFSDIDILLNKKDVAPASILLRKMGYNYIPYNATHEESFKNDTAIIDIHWDIAAPWLSKIKISHLWERVVYLQFDNHKFKTLSFEDMLLTLPLQIRCDFPGVRLIRCCDIHELLWQHKDSLDWDYILKAGREYRLSGSLLFALLLSKSLFSSPVPEEAIRKLVSYSAKRMLLSFIILKKVDSLFNEDLKFRKWYFRKYFLKFIMIDSLLDYFNIPTHKFKFIVDKTLQICHPSPDNQTFD